MALSKEEEAELAGLESQGLTSQEDAELAALEAEIGKPKESYLQKGLRGLDYDRALTGGPVLAKLLEKVSGKDVYREDEVEKARHFEADYPSSSELLERAGYAPDSKTAKFLLGLGLDVATAPSTYASGGLSALSKLSKLGKAGEVAKAAVNPIQALSKAAGKSTWKSAFKSLDVEALKQGKKIMPSQVLMEGGVSGLTSRGINKEMGNLAEGLLNARNSILEAATDAGGKIDVDKATRYGQELIDHYRSLGVDQADQVADAIATELKSFERLRPKAAVPATTVVEQVPSSLVDEAGKPMMRQVEKVIPGQPARPGTSPSKASDIKSFFYEGVPSSQWAPYAQTSAGTKLNKALSKGLKEATEDSAARALGPEAGTTLANLNERLGTLLSTRKKELGEVGKEEMKNLFTSVDALTLGALGASEASPKWWLLKKAADIAKLQGPRSTAGKLMYRFGDSVVAPKALERSAWSLLNKEEK